MSNVCTLAPHDSDDVDEDEVFDDRLELEFFFWLFLDPLLL